MTTFGLASLVFRAHALSARDLELAAGHGFTDLEIVAAPGHFDPGVDSAVADLRTAASSTGVSIVALTADLASVPAAVQAATVLDCPLVIVRTRACAGAKLQASSSADPGVFRKLIDDLAPASGTGLRIAFDFPSLPSLAVEGLVEFLEESETPGLGVCLDAGHANLLGSGGAVDAAEALSGFLTCVRLHDNHGREDNHRVPGAGAIDWAGVITACWKAGFTGPWMLAPVATPDAGVEDILRRAVGARTRLQAILEDLAQPFTFTE